MQIYKAAESAVFGNDTMTSAHHSYREDHCGPPQPPWQGREDHPTRKKDKRRFKQLRALAVLMILQSSTGQA